LDHFEYVIVAFFGQSVGNLGRLEVKAGQRTVNPNDKSIHSCEMPI
jgi:hypothetical protein